MRCLVLHQPWASLCHLSLSVTAYSKAAAIPVPCGLLTFGPPKIHETRPWPMPAHLIGKRVAIAAAVTGDGWKQCTSTLTELCLRYGLRPGGALDVRGVIVCTAVIQSCIPTESAAFNGGERPVSYEDRLCGDWSPRRFASRLAGVLVPAVPVPVKGMQGPFRIAQREFDGLAIQGCAVGSTVEE